jgi:hypothetical protein
MAGVARALDPAERFFWPSDRVSCMNFVGLAELDGSVDPLALRGAPDRAQPAHPMLQVRIAAEGEAVRFETVRGVPIPLREITVSDRDWLAAIEHELATPFGPGAAPRVRCAHLAFADAARSVVALVFHHAIADRRSGAECAARRVSCTMPARRGGAASTTENRAWRRARPSSSTAFRTSFRARTSNG